jgi:hypothetical protein
MENVFWMKSNRVIILIAVLISVGTLITWQATGGDYYTKFQLVERIEVPVDPNDPLAQTGFYDDSLMAETVSKDEFRLGLLPTPSRLFDEHILSVASVILPLWTLVVLLILIQRRKRRISSR